MVSYMMHGLDAIRLENSGAFGGGYGPGFEQRATETISLCKTGDDWNLFGGLAFAQAFQTIAEAALQWGRRIGIEGYQIPQRLAAVLAEPR